jgi:hypothetical protein
MKSFLNIQVLSIHDKRIRVKASNLDTWWKIGIKKEWQRLSRLYSPDDNKMYSEKKCLLNTQIVAIGWN